MKKAILDLETNEVEIRDFTKQELDQLKLEAEQQKALEDQRAAEQATRQAALDKLRAIGLTNEEISALVGA